MNDQSTPQSTPKSTFNIEQRISELRQIEKLCDEKEKEFEELIKPYKEGIKKYRTAIQQWLQEVNQESAKTKSGTAYLIRKTSWRIEDVEAFRRHVIGSEDWDAINWHVSKTVADARFELDKTELPGTKRDAMVTLGVKAPAKPRVKRIEPGQLTDEQWAAIEAQVDKELEPEIQGLEIQEGDEQ